MQNFTDSCSASIKSYFAFHAARLAKLEEFVAKEKAIMVEDGFNDSGPVEWECRYRGLKELSDFKESEVWEAAWKAAWKECEKNHYEHS